MKSLDKGESPVRALRIPDDLWQAYVKSCAVLGIKPADHLRAYMRRAVESASPSTTNDN